jgi:hypothetical protein
MGTARDIAIRALRRLGVVGAGEPAEADDYAVAIERLNTLCQMLVTEGASFPRISAVNQAVSWSALTPSYVTAPANYMNSLMIYRTENGSPLPLRPYTVQGWSDLQDKSATGTPDKFFDSPDGRWYLHPVPTSDPGITATFVERPAEFDILTHTSAVDFPVWWDLALEVGLSYYLADEFSKDGSRWVQEWERLKARALAHTVHDAPVTFTVDD